MRGCVPLTDVQVVACLERFRGRYRLRNRAFFLLGCLSGFRISEILSLRLRDVVQGQRVVRRVEVARGAMKGKIEGRGMPLQDRVRGALREWIVRGMYRAGHIGPDQYLFRSQRGGAISVVQAWRILRVVYQALDIPGRTGTHSMRKTFARKMYAYFTEAGHPDVLRAMQKALGHRNINSTISYLESIDTEVDEAAMRIRF